MSILNKNSLLELIAENKSEQAFDILTGQFKTIIDRQTAFLKEEYSQLRKRYLSSRSDKNYISLKEAQKRAFRINWENYHPPIPAAQICS